MGQVLARRRRKLRRKEEAEEIEGQRAQVSGEEDGLEKGTPGGNAGWEGEGVGGPCWGL